MLLAIILLIIWLTLLWYSANHLINTSVRIAQYFKVSALLIGLTVLAMGTSAPELFLSGMAAINWSWSLSVWNVIGSNIFNLWFILGLSAIVAPILIQKKLVYRDWVFLVFITCLIFWMLWDQHVAWREWATLLALLVWYNTFLRIKKESNWEEVEDIDKPKLKNFYILFWISILLCLITWENINWTFWLNVWIWLYWIIFLGVLLTWFLISLLLRRNKNSWENKLWMLLNCTKLIASLGILVLSSDLVVNAAVFIAQTFWV
jgi:cation:H+ antiporter